VAGRLSAGENNCSSGRMHYTSGGRPRSVTAVFAPRYRCIEGFSTGRKSRLDPATVLVCFGNGRGRRGWRCLSLFIEELRFAMASVGAGFNTGD
jgi:hypothetical protein